MTPRRLCDDPFYHTYTTDGEHRETQYCHGLLPLGNTQVTGIFVNNPVK